MTVSIETKRDDLEDMIVRALYFKRKQETRGDKMTLKSGQRRQYLSFAKWVPGKPHFPKDAITFDACDTSRIFGVSAATTLLNPSETLDGLEVMIFDRGTIKWMKYVQIMPPRGVVAITNRPFIWFAAHYRVSKVDGSEDYIREPVALHMDDGSVPLLKYLGVHGYDAEKARAEAETNVRLTLSIYEDSVRAGSFLATVEEAIKLRFPVGEDAYMDFLKLRDGYRDTPTGRKNPLIHWCAKHLRNSRTGRTHEVKRHMRGKAELTVGPMRMTLEYNDGSKLLAGGSI